MYLLHMTFQWDLNILPQEARKGEKKKLKKEDKSNKSQNYIPKMFFLKISKTQRAQRFW